MIVKILNHNINGIKAFIKRGGKDFINEINPDIMCFQEIKTQDESLVNFNGYHSFLNCCLKKKGYSGVSICIKNEIFKNFEKLNKDDYFDFNIDEGRILLVYNSKLNLLLITVYVPNSGETNLKFAEKRKLWNKNFLHGLEKIKMNKKFKNIIITGDFNVVRFVEKDAYKVKNQKVREKKTPGFLLYERTDFKHLLENTKFIDVGNDILEDNSYTYFSYRIKNSLENNLGIRIDYFLCNEEMKNKIKKYEVKKIRLSDHVPMILEINL